MKFLRNNISILIIAFVITSLATGAIIFLTSKQPITNKSKEEPNKDVLLYIDNIKNENSELELVYENEDTTSFKSMVYLENERYKNILIDTKTGKEINFKDLIKEDSLDNFEAREYELLALKYPEFIVNAIKENSSLNGTKVYFAKDNKVTIYYYDYSFLYGYNDLVSIDINYNEIKDYITFKPVFDEFYENENGYNYNKNKKVVALTFDDGPSSTYNSLIIEELRKNKAHATFFMVGKMMKSCEKCVIDTKNSGNEVASHTYEHMNIKKNDLRKVNESINKVNDIYHNLTGDNIKYLRPPYGAYSKTNLENATVPFILWNLDTEDWRYRNVDHIVNYILENVSDGSIILMHELYQTSYESLKIFLPKLYAMGYQVVNISELFALKDRTPEVGKAYRSLK